MGKLMEHNELKAYRSYANRDGFYHKSDVDKLLAEKDAKILSLDAEVFKHKHHAELFLDERNYAEEQLRHYKSEADKLLSCLKRLVMSDLIKECPEKTSAIEIVEKIEKKR